MPDMQVTVGLRRETRHDRATVLAGSNVLLDDVANKIAGIFCFGTAHSAQSENDGAGAGHRYHDEKNPF